MNNVLKSVDIVKGMLDDTTQIRNYIVPGISSTLLSKDAKIRVFTSTRDQQEFVTPHSHTFDLLCFVLKGHIINTLWTVCRAYYPEDEDYPYGDPYECVTMSKEGGGLGSYENDSDEKNVKKFIYDNESKEYVEGESYFMKHDEIHSIRFGRGSMVLIVEGPQKTDTFDILQPICHGKTVPTFKVEDWMFDRN